MARAQSALAATAELQHGGDLEVLAGPLLRAEALGSSFIEGYRASNKRLAIADYEPESSDPTARTVLGNVRAMEEAIELGGKRGPLRVEDLLEIHRVLLKHTFEKRFAGVIRQEQNWIGGRPGSPRDAAFVPPPPDHVESLLGDLVAFCDRDDLPAVVQAAIAHAQYETIHPHGDGNGRAGRCLIHVVLRRRGLTDEITPPVSLVLAATGKEYVRGLTAFRDGEPEEWIGYFASTVERAANAASDLGLKVDAVLGDLLEKAGSPRTGSVHRAIIEGLPAHPIVSADTAATRYQVTPTSARRALNALESAGVVSLTKVGRRRDREWAAEDLFDILDEFEFDLSQPDDPDSARRPAPTRHLRRER